MNKKKQKALREQLLWQRAEILKQHLSGQTALTVIPGENATGDAADAASNNDLKEMSLNLRESEKRALQGVEEALAKIKDGTYGLCDECGEPIPEKRLLARPQAKYCVACQEKIEKETG